MHRATTALAIIAIAFCTTACSTGRNFSPSSIDPVTAPSSTPNTPGNGSGSGDPGGSGAGGGSPLGNTKLGLNVGILGASGSIGSNGVSLNTGPLLGNGTSLARNSVANVIGLGTGLTSGVLSAGNGVLASQEATKRTTKSKGGLLGALLGR